MGKSANPIRLSGKRIIQLRAMHLIDQRCLAYEVNITRVVLSRIESDKSKEITLCTAYKLAKYFNVSIESLIE